MIQNSEYLSNLWIIHQSALKHHLPVYQAIGKGLVLAQKRNVPYHFPMEH